MSTMVTSTRLNIRLHAVFLYCLATRYVYPHLILSSFSLQFYKPFFLNTVKPALNGPFIKTEFVLNGNIFMSRDIGAETNVKYPGLNGNCLTRKRKSK